MATLKISELSVGDWVRNEDTIYKLYAIEECGLLRGVWEDSESIAHIVKNIDYFDPIHITTEMLKKNGLEYIDDGNDAVIFLCCDMFWARLCVGDTFWQVGIHGEDKLDAVVCNIKHVHQLQHALRLAGIDKEINL